MVLPWTVFPYSLIQDPNFSYHMLLHASQMFISSPDHSIHNIQRPTGYLHRHLKCSIYTHESILSLLSHVQLFAMRWTVACQAPLSIGFSQKEYYSGLPFPSPGHLPHPESNPWLCNVSWIAGRFFTAKPPRKPPTYTCIHSLLFLCFLFGEGYYHPPNWSNQKH